MAAFKYFSDVNGETFELVIVSQMPNEEFGRRFPGVKGMRVDGFKKRIGYAAGATLDSQALPMTRAIEMKRFPTKHECNAKCLNGKHDGACECQCGGKNHGRGMFTKMLEAA
ncbi:hypothetical protein [Delftia acidovorans]|uniref:hypothetical protein n=1 Tax=Delftia acidovorans TaxID=80866 RepID=UPI001EDC9811|nr:hypothetical protein [Delftia acidovorans]MCG3782745.1 hypothetical protein [Delftia acidovorans]